MGQSLKKREERQMKQNHAGERIPAQGDVRGVFTALHHVLRAVVQLMVDQRVPSERIVQGEPLDVHDVAMHEPFKKRAVNKQNETRDNFAHNCHSPILHGFPAFRVSDERKRRGMGQIYRFGGVFSQATGDVSRLNRSDRRF